jgi:hypothetical protein
MQDHSVASERGIGGMRRVLESVLTQMGRPNRGMYWY